MPSVALALLVAVGFAANSVFAALAYAGGSNAISVLIARSSVAFVVLLAVLIVARTSAVLPSSQRNVAFALGLLMAVSSYTLLGALEYMPVALCIITLYTYPLIVASFGWISGTEPFRIRFAVALIAAFAGLVLALDLPGAIPNITGIALSLTAAVSISILLIVSERVRSTEDSRPFTLHMLGACMVASIVAAPMLGEFTLPTTANGWTGFVAAPLCYAFGIIFLFVAISKIGSLKTAFVLNLEPVSSVVLSYFILSQSLKPLQIAGIVLVVAAISSAQERQPATLAEGANAD